MPARPAQSPQRARLAGAVVPRQRRRPVVTAWLAALLASALSLVAPAQAQDDVRNPPLPKLTLTAGIHRIQAEVADDAQSRQRGLMMRERLGNNEGMLFVFEDSAMHCFWMKNTPLPLSIAFLEDDGTVVNIEDMAPRSEKTHCPKRPIRFALEMEQGWFTHKGVGSGQRIGGLPAR